MGKEEVNSCGQEPIKDSSADCENAQHEEQTTDFELTGSKLVLVTVGLGLAIFLVSLDSAIIATAIPRITSRFESTPDIGWYGSAYTFAMCALQPMTGKLFASFSMKKVYLVFMAIFELGSLLCATAASSSMLIVGRAIAGIGGAGVCTGAMSILAVSLPLHKRPAFIGILHGTFGVATIIGPVLGGALTEYVSWRWCFWINLPVGAVTVVFFVFFFKPPAREADEFSFVQKLAKLDFIGASLFVPSIVMILLALQWGGTQHPWKSPTIIGLFVGGGGIAILFVLWQIYKGNDAMIPPKLFTQRTVYIASLIEFFAMGAIFTAIYYLPEWFQVVKGASPSRSGVMYLPLSLSDILSATLAGLAAAPIIGYPNPTILAGTALMVVGSGLFTTFTTTTNHQHWILYQVVQGLGAGMTISMPYIAIQTVLKPNDIPVGVAIVQLFQFFGGSVFIAVAQALFANKLLTEFSTQPGLALSAVDLNNLIHAGSASVRSLVDDAQLPAVISSYNEAIVSTFYVATAAASAAFIIALGLEWRSIKPKT